MTTATRRRLTGPPGFPIDWYLARLRHPAVVEGEWRREVGRTNALLWGLLYLPHHLESADTGGLVSLSEFHVEAARSAGVLMRTDLGPAEVRIGTTSARGSGKSTWYQMIRLLWMLAYEHRTFALVFGHTSSMARRHLLSLRAELAKNERLRADFPDLCTPRMNGRRSVMDTQDGYLARSGAVVIVAGLDQGTLGIKIENRRPDYILVDDGEPPDSNYSDHQKAQRLATLRESVLPMSINAAVDLVGTTTRLGSVMDDVRKGAPWTVEENFTSRHFPALIVDSDGTERSAWPDRWSLEYLQSIRHTHSFLKNFQCEPVSADGTHWRPEDFVYDTDGWLARNIDMKVLAVDPAVTSAKTSDETGLAIVGLAGNGKALVERATGVRMDPKALREFVHKTLAGDPSIRTVLLETSNGGEYIVQALEPMPRGVRMMQLRPTKSKLDRITELYDHYQRARCVHAKPLAKLEQQMCAWPQVATDDIVDAVDAAVRWLFERG